MSSFTASGRTASILIVGNEILAGRTTDTNSHWLCERLFALGISVGRIVTVPDEIEAIVQTVRDLSERTDYVIVTGGIGPTPDDVTRQAVALAFSRPLTTNPEAESIMRNTYRERINPFRLEMARLPEGSELIRNPSFAAPGFHIENVFVFPGVPQLMQEMFEQIVPRLETSAFYKREIAANLPESEFTQILYSTPIPPNVSVGSYPTMHEDGRWTVSLVVTGSDETAVQELAETLEAGLRELERSKGIRESN